MNTTSNTGFKHAKSAETIVLNPGTIDSDFKAHEKKNRNWLKNLDNQVTF